MGSIEFDSFAESGIGRVLPSRQWLIFFVEFKGIETRAFIDKLSDT